MKQAKKGGSGNVVWYQENIECMDISDVLQKQDTTVKSSYMIFTTYRTKKNIHQSEINTGIKVLTVRGYVFFFSRWMNSILFGTPENHSITKRPIQKRPSHKTAHHKTSHRIKKYQIVLK